MTDLAPIKAPGRLIVSRPGAPLLAALALIALACGVERAGAATVTNERPFLFAFDGSDSTAGRFKTPVSAQIHNTVAIDNVTGAVYVSDEELGAISKFNPDGTAADFSALDVSSLSAPANLLGIAVDNSEDVNPGRLHVSQFGNSRLTAFSPDGISQWTLTPSSGQFRDVAVDRFGHPWTLTNQGQVTQYDSSGAPPPPLSSFPSVGAGAIDLDFAGNLYVKEGSISAPIRKYVGSVLDPDALDASARDAYADQTNADGHIFTVDVGDFQEFDVFGALQGTFGMEYISAGRGIAYSPSLGRVYVTQFDLSDPTPVVAAFGPPTSGTVPDVTEIAEPMSVGVSSARFEGKLNPKGVDAEAHFEWKRPGESWAAAALLHSCPAGALPADESEHTVECETDELRGNTTYEVRLVTVNDADSLRAFSSVQIFTTAKATEPPEIAILAPDPIGTTTAAARAEINPKGDTADWRVEVAEGPGCESGPFAAEPWRQIEHGTSSFVAVNETLSGLLPSEDYCVRFAAKNSFSETPTTSAVETFTTEPVAPSGIETAFVAPRLDTTARLNGRVNPEGEALTYHFELSADEGASWEALPPLVDTSEARSTIVVAQEVSGLSPGTAYRYRFSAENPAGSGQGAEAPFATRTTSEVSQPPPGSCPNEAIRTNRRFAHLPDCRGFELVNAPDKGNQDVGGVEPIRISPSGDSALWGVLGGAPGGFLAAGNTFVARRTGPSEAAPAGWSSVSLAPPPERQLGDEYRASAMTPDFSWIIAQTRSGDNSSTLVRLDSAGNQELLGQFQVALGSPAIDLTADAAHVLMRNPETGQVEDFGSGEPAEPELISAQPDGQPSQCGTGGFNPGGGYRWMSVQDASRVYFLAVPNGSPCESANGLYVRDRDSETTTQIDVGTGKGNSALGPEFIRAATDGRSAFFVTASKLDPADTDSGGDVYRWQDSTGESTCLTCSALPGTGAEIERRNVSFIKVLVSDDLSHVYFESAAQLTPQASPGKTGVYALSGGETHFVAVDTNIGGRPVLDNAQLSGDGQTLVFPSKASPALTADPVEGPGGANQIYLYDDRTSGLECISCRRGAATTKPAADPTLSGDGSTVAFRTAEALVPEDVNGGADLYRWRAGSVRLITDGVSDFPRDPDVIGLDATGRDLFFLLVSPGLTGFEHDGLSNLYDARIGGGFQPPAPPQHCDQESCQGPLQAAPALDQPGSAAFSGRGNLSPGARRCGRAKLRRGERCVSKRALARRACRKKQGRAKRRCVRRQLRRLNRSKRRNHEMRARRGGRR